MIALLLAVACTPDPGTPPPGTSDTPPGPTTDGTDVIVPTPTDDTTDTDDTDPTEPTDPTGTYTPPTGVDCSAPLPAPPLSYTTLEGWGTAEDFDFDGDGYHVSMRDANLIRLNQDGDFAILSTGLDSFTSGTRVMPSGEVALSNSGQNEVLRIDTTTGAQVVITAGISYPNGIEVSRDGKWVYVASNGDGNVRQLDPITGDAYVVASDIGGANGLVLSTDENTMFVTTCSGEGVWKIPRIDETTWGEAVVLWNAPGAFACIDGVNVDACNNVYFTEYIAGKVRRMPADGLSPAEVIVDLPSSWIPNMRWGVGVGGWEPNLLYVSDRDDGRLFAIDTQIPGKKHVLAP